MTEEEEKSGQQNQNENENIDWHRSPQSESDPNPALDEQEDIEDKHLDFSALRSEETLEFRRKPKIPNGKLFF